MHTLGLPFLRSIFDLGPLALRLGVGLVFALHGWQKIQEGPATGFGEMLTGLDVPAPELTAWLVTIAELVGGILLILGLLTRLTTLPLIATMIGAMVLITAESGIIGGSELNIVLIAGLVGLLLVGPGRYSADHAVGIEPAPSRH